MGEQHLGTPPETEGFRPIRDPLLLLFCITLALFVGLNILITAWMQRHEADHAKHAAQRGYETLLQQTLNQEANNLSGQLDFIEQDEALAEAYLSGDRELLLKHVKPVYERLKQRFDVTHFYFHRPDKSCFLRVHNPPRHSDRIDRWTLNTAATTQREASGIELGPLGTFTLRVVRPWTIDGQLIGFLELGKEVERFTATIKEVLGLDFFVLIDTSRLDREQWAEGLQVLDRTPLAPWDALDDRVIVDGTLRPMPHALLDWMKKPKRGTERRRHVRVGDRLYDCALVPLFDVTHTRVGEVAILLDQTEMIRDHARSSGLFIIILIATGTVVISVFWRVFERLKHKLDASHAALAQARGKLETRVAERTRELATTNAELREEIAHRKQVEEALIEAKQRAEAATEAKSRFLSAMSHELRTPMNAIIGVGEVLVDTELGRDQAHFIRILQSAGDDLLNVINDILDISKIESGELTLESIDFDLSQLVEETCDMLAIRARTKGLDLALRLDRYLPVHVVGDPHRLRQILINLIGNAVKFTERGYVSVEVSLDEAAAPPASERPPGSQVALVFSIRDTGIGIPEDKQEQIFESFTQVDSSTTRQYGGTGLGLGISRRLTTLMGGTIEVQSAPGCGSLFAVRLPMKTSKDETVSAPLAEIPNLPERRVLIVDDIEVNRLILGEMLQEWGMDFAEAENAKQALTMLNAARNAGRQFDTLLLDYWMPGMDGLDLASIITQDPRFAELDIVMLASDSLIMDKARTQRTRLAGHLVKPVKKRDLKRLLLGFTQGATGTGTSSAEQGATDDDKGGSLPAARILVVEDSPYNRTLIQAFLARTPLQVDYAENGAEAIEKWNTNPYTLVLMDMQMPVMDGYEATTAIREQERIEDRAPTPIVALTAFALTADVDKCLAAGCDAHLAKPIRKRDFFRMLHTHLGVASPPTAEHATQEETPPMEEHSEIFAYAEPELLPFAQEFLDTQRETLECLRALLLDGRFEDIRRLGHTMKGEGGGYGLEEVSVIGAAIQDACELQAVQTIATLLDRLDTYLDQVRILPKS
ncbi:hybrid sensor histidine kinase/response regulator [Thiorhodococcus fuscus]|uniref:histidine kinase n=1 Tax=Thiorhodococcus fuscus TaxID=527200 RepID=A0ABW4Y9E6_9GAMM